MSRPRLLAHVVVVSADVSRWGGTTTLIGVDYVHQLPADTEFPRTVRKLDVFTRFFVYGGGPETVRVEVWWLSPDGTDRQLIHGYNHEVPFDPTESVRDWVFRLTNVRLPGEGRSASAGWSGPGRGGFTGDRSGRTTSRWRGRHEPSGPVEPASPPGEVHSGRDRVGRQ